MPDSQKPKPPNDMLDWLGISNAPNWHVARLLGWLIGSLLIVLVPVLFVAALLAACAVLYHTFNLALSGSDQGLNLGAGALIAALLGAPFLVWGTWLKYQTVRYQKEGHITDRINKAVEMLGAEKVVKLRSFDPEGKVITSEETHPNIEVRIGAILSLERIAQDSTIHDKGRDHVRLMEILCAYVRENAKAENLIPTEPPFAIKVARLDIQKAIDVIKRRSESQRNLEVNVKYRLDLRTVDFDGADLSKGDFTGAILTRSRFEGASLEGTNLTGARMAGCLLNYASWHGAKLRGTSLDYCILNRPKPTPGGMNEHSPTFGEIKGISVIAADLSAIDYFGENPETSFGSKDTVLCDAMDELRNEASKLFSKREAARRKNDPARLAELNAELGDNPFLHWIPYSGSDMGSGRFRAQRFSAWGLSGWPFED